MKTLRRMLLAALAGLFLSTSANAEIVVVVAAKSGMGALSREEVTNIYLGRHRKLPSGQVAQPIDLPGSDTVRARFYRQLVNKSVAEINAYWARLLFSGKTNPPEVSASPRDVLAAVATKPGAVGYLERSQIDERVHIVFALEE